MSDYGVTDKGFVIKRMDVIMEEVHNDLTEGFGFDTRLLKPSFLDVLVTSACGQLAELWEELQNSYYAKYPATATGVNLDNAVQYGGIRREANQKTCYPLHCTGDDGTDISDAVVATATTPEIRLSASPNDSTVISRENFNSVSVRVAAVEIGVYTISINGTAYSYTNAGSSETEILNGLASAVTDSSFSVSVANNTVVIESNEVGKSNVLILSDNLTTASVTSIVNFLCEDYGKITLPNGIIITQVNNIAGFRSVTNLVQPSYGRLQETDVELRQAYIAKSALRSNTMLDSIVSELLNNVEYVETATGYENDGDTVNSDGLPPHSVELVVEGGSDTDIANAILRRKAGGIQTYGSVVVNVPGVYGESIPIKFNRPTYLYAWIKVILHGDAAKIPANYQTLTVSSITNDCNKLSAGSNLLIQSLTEGLYDTISGLTYIDIYTAYSTSSSYVPESTDYEQSNIIVSTRQKVLVSSGRIEVSFNADNS